MSEILPSMEELLARAEAKGYRRGLEDGGYIRYVNLIRKDEQTRILNILHGIDTQVEQMVRDALGEQTDEQTM